MDHGCAPLLSILGGEGIYMGTPAVSHEPVQKGWPDLRKIGKPSIVEAVIDLSAPRRQHPTFAPLPQVFLGIERGLELTLADVFYRALIPPDDIIAIWQPGDPDLRSPRGLPRY